MCRGRSARRVSAEANTRSGRRRWGLATGSPTLRPRKPPLEFENFVNGFHASDDAVAGIDPKECGAIGTDALCGENDDIGVVLAGFAQRGANEIAMDVVAAVDAEQVVAACFRCADFSPFSEPFVVDVSDELPENAILLRENSGGDFIGAIGLLSSTAMISKSVQDCDSSESGQSSI